jgi:hypothetical protein
MTPAGAAARNGPLRWRIDGYPKVTGAKLYPADFRASDMAGWPAHTTHAMLLLATDVIHIFAGVDLSGLEGRCARTGRFWPSILPLQSFRVPAFYVETCYARLGRHRPIWASRLRC